MAAESSLASSILKATENGIWKGRHVLPQDIDIGNFVPLLNSFACAANELGNQNLKPDPDLLPFNQDFDQEFPEARIYIAGYKGML